jgi:adenosylcobinamide-phosphate guanylyltransferase
LKIPTLILAGGKGKRMESSIEKPLILFLGNPLLDWVVKAVASANQVSEFYVVTSANTPETEKHCLSKGWKILHTDAKGYHSDLKQAVQMAKLQGPILTIPADLPAITGKFLDKTITTFEKCQKEFLAVFVPIKTREKYNLSISSTDEYKGIWHAVTGVNIINAQKIQTSGKIETSAIITQKTEVLLNINTPQDLEIAQKLMQKPKKITTPKNKIT